MYSRITTYTLPTQGQQKIMNVEHALGGKANAEYFFETVFAIPDSV
jgi:hypothetical protein